MKKATRFFNPIRRQHNKQNNEALNLFRRSCQLINENLVDIKRTFRRVAFVGSCPNYLLSMMSSTTLRSINTLTICDVSQAGLNQTRKLLSKLEYMPSTKYELLTDESWPFENESLDVILSSLHLHSINNPQKYIQKQVNTLVPDGAFVGTSFGPSTLEQLRISYILAQNERYGGISPHIFPFVELSDIGNSLSHSNLNIPTIIKYVDQAYFQSPIDLLSFIQSIGQNSCLYGSRSGSFRDLLIAMLAIYASTAKNSQNYVRCTIQFANFVAWRYSDTQRKPLERGSQDVHMGSFVKEVQDEAEDLIEYGVLKEDQVEPEFVEILKPGMQNTRKKPPK